MEVAASGRKAIVFSQWVEPLECLARALARLGPLLFHGRVPSHERQAILERFSHRPAQACSADELRNGQRGLEPAIRQLCVSLRSLVESSRRGSGDQPAHRIGQREPVFVTRFITPGTIESRIAEVLERKRQLFTELIEHSSPPPSIGLTEEEVFGLFNIQPRRRRTAA